MKGTRLWQNTGSPLISGRSQRYRPLWHQVLLGWTAAVAVVVVFVVFLAGVLALPRLDLPAAGAYGPLPVIVGSLAYAAVPALIGAWFGVWLARNMGWNRQWIAGTAIALLGAFVWLALSASPL